MKISEPKLNPIMEKLNKRTHLTKDEIDKMAKEKVKELLKSSQYLDRVKEYSVEDRLKERKRLEKERTLDPK